MGGGRRGAEVMRFCAVTAELWWPERPPWSDNKGIIQEQPLKRRYDGSLTLEKPKVKQNCVCLAG